MVSPIAGSGDRSESYGGSGVPVDRDRRGLVLRSPWRRRSPPPDATTATTTAITTTTASPPQSSHAVAALRAAAASAARWRCATASARRCDFWLGSRGHRIGRSSSTRYARAPTHRAHHQHADQQEAAHRHPRQRDEPELLEPRRGARRDRPSTSCSPRTLGTRSTSQWYSESGAPITTNAQRGDPDLPCRAAATPTPSTMTSGYITMRWYQHSSHGTKPGVLRVVEAAERRDRGDDPREQHRLRRRRHVATRHHRRRAPAATRARRARARSATTTTASATSVRTRKKLVVTSTSGTSAHA